MVIHMPRIVTCAVTGFSLLGLALAVSASHAVAQGKQVPDKEAQQKLKKELLKAARKVYETALARHKFANAPGFTADDFNRWSRRWLDAQLSLADSKEARATAYREHLDRTRALERMAQALWKSGQIAVTEMAASEYFRIQAELWLEESKDAPQNK